MKGWHNLPASCFLFLYDRPSDGVILASDGLGRAGMMLWRGITGITGFTRCCNGLWRFLITRTKGRVAIELKRERNRATADVIRLLPGDCELVEYEPEGRLRVIRRSRPTATGPALTGEARLSPSGELDR